MVNKEKPEMESINEQIQAKEIRVVDAEGNQLGVFSREEALRQARNAGLDLVAIVENAVPPVCKIIDYGKFKYEKSKRERAEAAKARANQIHVREIQLRPVTDDNDISVKARKAKEFLQDGDKVKLKVKFRGREVAHNENGREIINTLIKRIGVDIIFEKDIVLAGRDMTAVIAMK